jgi:hypothetical protein
MKTTFIILILLITSMFSVFASSCEKDDSNSALNNPPMKNTPGIATSFGLGWDYNNAHRSLSYKERGYSVRCVRD